MQQKIKRILVTGATGNVGREVINALENTKGAHPNFEVLAGVRNVDKYQKTSPFPQVRAIAFDFESRETFSSAFAACDVLFLLRPPQIANVKKYFEPLIETAKQQNIKHIVFLSVQGADANSVIPHHKIEKLITDSRIPYTFLRPSYFMQNFTTTLQKDLLVNQRIYLPAGNAKFNLIDARDIGKVTAVVLSHYKEHQHNAYELTGEENLSFQEMADILSQELSINIRYKSPNLLLFFLAKRKEGVAAPMIFVMIMLHYLPRFQGPPNISHEFEKLTQSKPVTFSQFVRDHKDMLLPSV